MARPNGWCEERETFKLILSYARDNADSLAGLLFFKVDRAARNLFDYVELERLEADYGVTVIYVTQQTENNPAGRMMRRTLANMASFYTEQQSIDVRDGLSRRVQSGLFVSKAPYGYRNYRQDGRSLVKVDQEKAEKVRIIFNFYAYGGHTVDSLLDKLDADGIHYTKKTRRFVRAKLHNILRDRSYIGEVNFHGEWFPGTHQPIIDRPTFDRVQTLLGNQVYRSHELVYAGDLIKCGHCGNAITGEVKTKQTKKGPKDYRYYRCARYNKPGHPRIRLKEADLDEQVLAMFRQIRIDDADIRDWFVRVLHARTRNNQELTKDRVAELSRQVTMGRNQQDQLLNLRLLEEIDETTFAQKGRELRDRLSELNLQIEASDRGRAEHAEIAVKAFELSQTLEEKWVNADYRAKHQLLEIVCLNFSLDGVTLVPEIRKPFDVLAKGLISENSRGDPRQSSLYKLSFTADEVRGVA